MKNRRFKILRVSPEILLHMSRPGKSEVESSPLPKDASFGGAYFNHMSAYFEICVISKEYKEVPEGALAPYIEDMPSIKTL